MSVNDHFFLRVQNNYYSWLFGTLLKYYRYRCLELSFLWKFSRTQTFVPRCTNPTCIKHCLLCITSLVSKPVITATLKLVLSSLVTFHFIFVEIRNQKIRIYLMDVLTQREHLEQGFLTTENVVYRETTTVLGTTPQVIPKISNLITYYC